MNVTERADKIINELPNYKPSFKEGFSKRVMERINDVDAEIYYLHEYGSYLLWVTLSGVAAILLLLMVIYYNDGTLQSDAIFGILDYSPDDPYLASLNF